MLTRFVNTAIMARGHLIAAEDRFESAGVDSMGLIKVLLFIEAEFGFWMPDTDLVEDNLTSPRVLAEYLCRRLQTE